MSVENLSTGIEASASGESLNSGDPAVHPAARHRLHLSACIQAVRYSKVEHFGIDVADAAIGLRSMTQKMKEMWSKTR